MQMLVNQLLNIMHQIMIFAQDNVLLSALAGFFLAFMESFIPILPLMAIVAANGALNGFWIGFIVSLLGSACGTFIVFYLFKHIFKNKKFNKNNNQKVQAIMEKINKAEFTVIFLFYAISILPASLTTIAAAYCKFDYKDFLPPMFFGKLLMMSMYAYVGSDYKDFFTNPYKLVIGTLITIVIYFIGSKVNKSIDKKIK
ncbi:TVP38/TMEM64 family protein [Peptostreptococcus equinus]|uniref:TVP38/TMEM64 family membrane protein n=1 Tax=Peptostreptococcus equinus TaxID=3003601 RepID=A0ABY7JLH5_9FIRM|nr:VTT domain-containing protein [Peptostreptococcus sp. CBA3647]WAW13999.1 VTT domain-containing protein [Peptostreptococcus sp. CBA3647]